MKALVLLSGGLDSSLAAAAVREQGVEVEAVNFQMPFCPADAATGSSCGSATRMANVLGLRLWVLHLGDEFVDIVVHPRHGRGKNMNPCVDCRILMLAKTRDLLAGAGASFVVTGEVLGQRPLSQHWRALRTVERESGLDGLVLRPLSARLLPPTIPEIEGWVDRSRLLAFQGRSRKEQLALAGSFGIQDPPTPAGGCLLTDPAYSSRLRDVLEHAGSLSVHVSQLIRHGRFFRVSPESFAVIGRNERDNDRLETMQGEEEWLFRPLNCPGPSAIGVGAMPPAAREAVAGRVARYSDRPGSGTVEIEMRRGRAGERAVVSVRAPENPPSP